MVEITDIQELDKLSPNPSSNTNRESSAVAGPKEHKWRLILEPALAGAMLAINLGQTSLQNLYLRTACTVDLGYPKEICDRGVGEEFRAAEAASQMIVSSINVSRSFVGALICSVVLMFVGPWSDCSGRRKPLLILPLAGMCVMTTGVLLLLIFPGASTVQVLYIVQIPISMGGNFGLLLAASFSHIGDLCHASGRDVTRTMGAHRAAVQAAHVAGALAGPLLYRHLGFYGVFPLVFLLQVSSLLYVVIAVKDVNVNTDNKVSVCDWRLPLAAGRSLLRRRAGRKRLVILLMLLVALADRMLLSAEVLLAYMYYRYKFKWDDVMFGSFLAYRNIASFAGTIIILTVLKRRLRLSDEAVGILSCCSYILATAGLIAARSTFVVFLLPLVGIIAQGSQVVQKPIINKQILPNEQGKIYSVMGALEYATQMVSAPLYSLLYSKTVSTATSAWLLPGIVLALLQSLAYFTTTRLSSNAEPEKNSQLATREKTDVENQLELKSTENKTSSPNNKTKE